MEDQSSVQDHKNSLKQKAEHLITKGFPEKIVKLNALLETPNFQNRQLADVHQDLNIPVPPPAAEFLEPNAKRRRMMDSSEVSSNTSQDTRVYALPNGTAPCNKPVGDLINLVEPHVRELVEDSKLLKMWISLMIPKIEDGNNFGVSIQVDTLGEIESVESRAAAFINEIPQYNISRAKIVSKVAKYPHIEDYRRAVQRLDENEYQSLRLVMCEIRDCYCSLHDFIIKNLKKIKKPRSSNTGSLY